MKTVTADIIQIMRSTGIVPLFSHADAAIATQMVEATYKGGIRILEFTNRNPNALSVFEHLVKNKNRYPELKLGIGTVLNGETTQQYIDAGADFIVSPILHAGMAQVCSQNNIPWIPGCATLTEIVTARDLGAEVIKVFPGSVLGPGFVSAILPVVPNLNLLITGGVELNEDNLTAWFKAGSLCVGLGSHLFSKDMVEDRAWDELQLKVTQALSIVRKIKAGLNPS